MSNSLDSGLLSFALYRCTDPTIPPTLLLLPLLPCVLFFLSFSACLLFSAFFEVRVSPSG